MVVAGGGRELEAAGTEQAVALTRLDREPAPAGAARGKVVFCGPHGATLVYQADQEQTSAALCACGNATGAAAALQAHSQGRAVVRQAVKLPDGWVAARAVVTVAEGGAWRVEQTWGGVQLHVQRTELCGRTAALCMGTFNEYLLVRLGSKAELEAFGLEDALALWREGRRFGAFEDPLRSRLVALAPAGERAAVKFYTCGRMHPGAPLTGLAVLAAAADRIDWLSTAWPVTRSSTAAASIRCRLLLRPKRGRKFAFP